MNERLLKLALAGLLGGLLALPATLSADDSAADSTYDDGWSNADNGGDEFGNWTLTGSTNAGLFIGDSATNGFASGSPNINTAGRAWGLYANSGETSSAVRPFTTPLPSSGQVAVHMDNGWIDGGTVGIGLQNASSANLVEVYFNSGDSFYTVNDGTAITTTTVGWTDSGIDLLFTNQGSGTYDVTITSLNGAGSQTLSGRSLQSPGGGQAIAQIRLFNYNAGPGDERNAYFNSLKYSATGGLPVELDSFTID